MGIFDDAKQQAEKATKDHPEQVEKFSDQAVQRGGDLESRRDGVMIGVASRGAGHVFVEHDQHRRLRLRRRRERNLERLQ